MTYKLYPGGQLQRISDGAWIPQDGANADYQAFLQWEAANDVESAELGLSYHRTLAIQELERQANAERARVLPASESPVSLLAWHLRLHEAVEAAADGTPTAGEYPILDAEVPYTAATIALVATAVLAEALAVRVALAEVEAVRLAALAGINMAGDEVAVRAILEALEWGPRPIHPEPVVLELRAAGVSGLSIAQFLTPDPVALSLTSPAVSVA